MLFLLLKHQHTSPTQASPGQVPLTPLSPGLSLGTCSMKPPLSCVWLCLPHPLDRWCRVTSLNTCHLDGGASQEETPGLLVSFPVVFPKPHETRGTRGPGPSRGSSWGDSDGSMWARELQDPRPSTGPGMLDGRWYPGSWGRGTVRHEHTAGLSSSGGRFWRELGVSGRSSNSG